MLFFALLSVATSLNHWLAVGRYADPVYNTTWALASSVDGKTWSPTVQSNKVLLNPYVRFPASPTLAFGAQGVNGRWVLGGDPVSNATIFTSDDDGVTFVPATGADGPAYPRAIAFGGATGWLALMRARGASAPMFLFNSTDAKSWTNHTSANLPMEDVEQQVDLRFVSSKKLWLAVTGRGVFQSADTFNWTFINVSFDARTQMYTPFASAAGAPYALAVSPFGEYWVAVGPFSPGFSQNFVFSNTGNSLEWFSQQTPALFGGPTDFSVARDVAYGSGQFVVVGNAENPTGPPAVNNTIFVATNTSYVVGIGGFWFTYAGLPAVRSRVYAVKYSEIQSLFVLCGSYGDAQSSIIFSLNPLANDFNRTNAPFDAECRALATREEIPDFPTAALVAGSVNRTQVVSVTADLTTLNVVGGDLKANGMIRFSQTSVVNVSGSLYCSGVTRILPGCRVSAGSAVVAFPNSSVLEIEINDVANRTSILVPLFSYSLRVGSFLSARSIYSGIDCTVSLGNPVVLYSSSTASALISVTQGLCPTSSNTNTTSPGQSSSQLSTGAIIGIAVGASVAGVAIAVGMVFLMKYFLNQRDLVENQRLRNKEMTSLKAAVV